MRKHWSTVFGYFEERDCKVVRDLCAGEVVLEIGSLCGRSTMCIAEVAKKVYTIDTFKSHDNGVDQMDKFTTLSIFAENVKGYDNIVAIAGKSEEIVPALRLEVGVVFIDGWHEYEQVKKDIEVCGPKLKEGGIMIFHDFASYHNHVGRAVKELGVQYWNPIPQLAVVVKKGEANAFN